MRKEHLTRTTTFSLLIAIIFVLGCKQAEPFVRNVEAIDDKSAYRKAEDLQDMIDNHVIAHGETHSVRSEILGADTADDPAIWYNEIEPEKSVIFGTNKKKGIHAYNLTGEELQYIEYASINNIDVRQNVNLNGDIVDVLAGSNKSGKSIDIYIIDENGSIAEKPDYIFRSTYQPYGFCLHKSKNGQLYSFFNDKYGNVLQHLISVEKDSLRVNKVRKLKLASQAEGMVVDDKNEILYIGEEQKGIHFIDADPKGGTSTKILAGSTIKNKNIQFDIEGLALLPPHYLVASSQGNFSYAIFDIKSKKYVTSFTITATKNIDGCEETDGIEILRRDLGDSYPSGIMIAQDGFNTYGMSKKNQNFKMVDLQKVIDLIELD